MPDILSEIIANKRIEVELQKQSITIEQLYEGVSDVPPTRSMKQALATSRLCCCWCFCTIYPY